VTIVDSQLLPLVLCVDGQDWIAFYCLLFQHTFVCSVEG